MSNTQIQLGDMSDIIRSPEGRNPTLVKYNFDVLINHVDCALTKSVDVLNDILDDKETGNETKIRAVGKVIDLGRYMEARKENIAKSKEVKALDEYEDDLDDIIIGNYQ